MLSKHLALSQSTLIRQHHAVGAHFGSVFFLHQTSGTAKLDLMAGRLRPTETILKCPCVHNMASNLPCVAIWQESTEVMMFGSE